MWFGRHFKANFRRFTGGKARKVNAEMQFMTPIMRFRHLGNTAWFEIRISSCILQAMPSRRAKTLPLFFGRVFCVCGLCQWPASSGMTLPNAVPVSKRHAVRGKLPQCHHGQTGVRCLDLRIIPTDAPPDRPSHTARRSSCTCHACPASAHRCGSPPPYGPRHHSDP